MKKGLTAIVSLLMLGFYAAIVFYIFFAVIHINIFGNFVAAIVFEIIGIALLAIFIMQNILCGSIKTGYFVPLIIVTVVYTIILDAINIVYIALMPNVFFVLINLVLLFVYCMISAPMYIMGRKNRA